MVEQLILKCLLYLNGLYVTMTHYLPSFSRYTLR